MGEDPGGHQVQEAKSGKGVEKAVIPAAGIGSRMLHLTRSVPKEMLPVGGKPMVQHVVEEAVASGLNRICIVISEGKEVIRNHFSRNHHAGQLGQEEVAALEALVATCELTFVYQKEQLGLGDALLQAKDFVGTDSFVMMIPDQLMSAAVPAAAQLIGRFSPGPFVWSSLLRLPKQERPFFVGARGVEYEELDLGTVAISRFLTENETRLAHRSLSYEVRGFGRTIYPPEIFDYLGADFINPQSGEVDLLKTFEKCTEELKIFGVWLDGAPFDLGTLGGYYRYLPRILELESRQAARNASQG